MTSAKYNSLWYNSSTNLYSTGYPISQVLLPPFSIVFLWLCDLSSSPPSYLYFDSVLPLVLYQILALESGQAGSNAPAVFASLVNLINNGTYSGFPNAPTGGIVFTKYSWPVLSAGGRTDLALQVLVSFSYWASCLPLSESVACVALCR